jgi:hypothetical protein
MWRWGGAEDEIGAGSNPGPPHFGAHRASSLAISKSSSERLPEIDSQSANLFAGGMADRVPRISQNKLGFFAE